VKEKVKILFFCMIFVAGRSFAQKNEWLGKKNLSILSFNQLKSKEKKSNWLSLTQQPMAKTEINFYLRVNTTTPLLAPNFYTSHLGFFCKQELKLNKAIKVPFKFRLGTVQQCDWLEGKTGAVSY
jgi:hypothetical protein